MGGEKFFNIKCRASGLRPSCAVVVCTVRALKLHSNEAPKVVAGSALAKEYCEENLPLVEKGACNLLAHIKNVSAHGVRVVVAINRFHTDTDAEVALIAKLAKAGGAFDAVEASHFAHGGAGAAALGRAVMAACETANTANFKFLYPSTASIKQKIEAIVRGAYGGAGAAYSDQVTSLPHPSAHRRSHLPADDAAYFVLSARIRHPHCPVQQAEARIKQYETDPMLAKLPVCMSKTQYSLTDDATKLGAPTGFTVTVKDIYASQVRRRYAEKNGIAPRALSCSL